MANKHLFRIAIIAVLSCSSYLASAQTPAPPAAAGMAINTTGAAADASAILDVSSSTQGVLVPRMSSSTISLISNPATGLLVFQTDGTAGFYYNSGTPASPTWTAVSGSSSGGGLSEYADFYALMFPDNAATVAVGTDVSFPQNGPASGSIDRLSPSTFQLTNIGTYQVSFQVSVTEAGQLDLSLNGSELAYTVVGRATGTSQITGVCLVQTTGPNSVLTVRNPITNSTALTITPLAGGASPVSAHLVITRIQ